MLRKRKAALVAIAVFVFSATLVSCEGDPVSVVPTRDLFCQDAGQFFGTLAKVASVVQQEPLFALNIEAKIKPAAPSYHIQAFFVLPKKGPPGGTRILTIEANGAPLNIALCDVAKEIRREFKLTSLPVENALEVQQLFSAAESAHAQNPTRYFRVYIEHPTRLLTPYAPDRTQQPYGILIAFNPNEASPWGANSTIVAGSNLREAVQNAEEAIANP